MPSKIHAKKKSGKRSGLQFRDAEAGSKVVSEKQSINDVQIGNSKEAYCQHMPQSNIYPVVADYRLTETEGRPDDVKKETMRECGSSRRSEAKNIHIAAVLSLKQRSTSMIIWINDDPIKSLLDSGSDMSLISLKCAELCKLEIKKPSFSFNCITAGGQRLNPVGEAETVIRFGSKLINVRLLIVDTLIKNLIIGTDVMIPHKFKLDFVDKILSIGYYQTEFGLDKPIPISIQISTVVPAMSEKRVWLTCPKKAPD